ncbi:hypothetical protein BOTNAR_0063g00180 [Botryotinia narcissicola]|uniref:Uncharacterized protein n=1 Tax=Botryotinia narcissicola TaxID=278944 RepID=A0A4Z1IYA7_9HELO|nr:hypothetical protein BOTNAR_0063g00180 [Botryotinia narcissicola]
MDIMTGNSSLKSVRWLRTTRSYTPLLIQKSFCLFLTTLLLFTSLGFCTGAYWQSLKSNTPFGQVAKEFELHEIFTEAPSFETNAAWGELIPRGRGFVVVDSTDTPVPYVGIEANLAQVRAVAVYHQIHCLNELRLGYYANQTLSVDRNATIRQHYHSENHMKHCFDYLRQSLMCASDTTLETLQVKNEGNKPAVDGWGTTHLCRDYDKVSDWTLRHRASDIGGV